KRKAADPKRYPNEEKVGREGIWELTDKIGLEDPKRNFCFLDPCFDEHLHVRISPAPQYKIGYHKDDQLQGDDEREPVTVERRAEEQCKGHADQAVHDVDVTYLLATPVVVAEP